MVNPARAAVTFAWSCCGALAKAAVFVQAPVVAVGRPWWHVLVAILDATATGTWQGAS